MQILKKEEEKARNSSQNTQVPTSGAAKRKHGSEDAAACHAHPIPTPPQSVCDCCHGNVWEEVRRDALLPSAERERRPLISPDGGYFPLALPSSGLDSARRMIGNCEDFTSALTPEERMCFFCFCFLQLKAEEGGKRSRSFQSWWKLSALWEVGSHLKMHLLTHLAFKEKNHLKFLGGWRSHFKI